MKKNIITINSYAKINLSLDVLGKREDGYHLVDMVMQQIDLHDEVTVRWLPDDESGDVSRDSFPEIELRSNKRYLPTDRRNIAYKAAELMAERYAADAGKFNGKIRIDIKKQIPVAAGLAGGSGNGAAVIHALSYLWGLKLPLSELCAIGAQLGADVPFCIMGQAGADVRLRVPCKSVSAGNPVNAARTAAPAFSTKTNAARTAAPAFSAKTNAAQIAPACCARATGTGTELIPLCSVDAWVLLTKPPISVSTAEVYKGIDAEEIVQRPNTSVLIEGICEKNTEKITKNMINVLELFTLKMYPSVMYTKNKVAEQGSPLKVMMSGSGPTIFALYKNKADADAAFAVLRQEFRETYVAHTILPK